MKEFELQVLNETGLHARPARTLVNLTRQFRSEILVFNGEKRANAKSMISILTLGAERGAIIRFRITGEDDEAAAAAVAELVNSGLGDDPPAAREGDTPSPPAGAGASPTAGASPVPASALPAPTTTSQDAADGRSCLVRGIAAAPGIAIGPVHHLRRERVVLEETFGGAACEHARLLESIRLSREQLVDLRERMGSRSPAEAAIFDAHLEILDDPELLDEVRERIQGQETAARAWQSVVESRAAIVAALADPVLAARAADVRDVGDRVLRLLAGAGAPAPQEWPDGPVVVVAPDLSPSDTVALDRTRVLGFCTAGGGPTSHSAILARALGFPAVVGAGDAVLALADGATLIVDGGAGTVVVDPDEETRARALEARQRFQAQRSEAREHSSEPAVTVDGHRVEVVANIGGVGDARGAHALGAEGVGLLRTEFLFLDRATAPGEQEQFEVYCDVAVAMDGRPVIIRTLDIGGDKPLPYVPTTREENPFLGVRGIRLCLERPDLLRPQLRAILRAATAGHVRIMFPMVSDLAEWRAARAMVDEIRAELYLPQVEMGIMIEVPAAALMADVFAREVDFFSIGTNDLTQYTLAMDRMHPTLAARSDGLHPAVLRLVARTVEAAHAEGKWVGVCGELGADPQAVPILVGIGVDELSVGVPAIPLVKAQVRSLSLEKARQLALDALACATAAEVRALAGHP